MEGSEMNHDEDKWERVWWGIGYGILIALGIWAVLLVIASIVIP